MIHYCWRWIAPLQNDFAARADWCVKSYEEANHAPVVMLAHEADMQAEEGSRICLSAEGTKDPDGDKLTYRWWQYQEAGTYGKCIDLQDANDQRLWLQIPSDIQKGETIHMICEVSDNGTPSLTRYQRVVITIK